MPEQYVVIIDGCAADVESVSRGGALGSALAAVDSMGVVDVAVADARTLRVCARWQRTGIVCRVRAIEGWLT